jgi:hypothetical protein
MSCPHLREEYLKSCFAAPEVYVPSMFQLDQYCTSEWYWICPLFRQRCYRDGVPVQPKAPKPIEALEVLGSGS